MPLRGAACHVFMVLQLRLTGEEPCNFLSCFEFDTSKAGMRHCVEFDASEAFAYWKGDMEAHVFSHFLEQGGRYYKCLQCCDFCLATTDKRAPELTWGDLSLRALWRQTMTMRHPSDPSPWTAVPRFEKAKRLIDLLHIVHLGTLRDIVASVICDSLEDGSLAHFYGLESHTEILDMFSRHAEKWSRGHGMQLYIGKLTRARLGRPLQQHWPFPCLDSRIKAAKTRTLFGFCTFVMCRVASTSESWASSQQKKIQANVRATCCWALDVVLSTFSQNNSIVMPPAIVAVVACVTLGVPMQAIHCRVVHESALLQPVDQLQIVAVEPEKCGTASS